MIYSAEQIKLYLYKIGYKGKIEMNEDTLSRLQIAHLKSIPYENLDILNHVKLSLDAEDLFKKIIIGHRGGYCFELNGLYSNLLKSMGFNVINFAGRFPDDENKMRRHRILKVTLKDGEYICDVGVRNESPRKALKFEMGIVQDDGVSKYKFEKDDFYGNVLWQKEVNKKYWKRMYGFTEEPQLDIDYIMPSFFCETHPDSPFIGYKKISIFTHKANITLVGNTFKFYEKGKVTKKLELKSRGEVENILEKYFRVKICDRKNYNRIY